MLNWIAGFVARWQPVVGNAVRDLVHWTIHALASVVYTVFGNVGKAWDAVVAAVRAAYDQAKRFVDQTVWALEYLIKTYVPKVFRQAEAWWHDALNTAKFLFDEITATLKADYHTLTGLIQDVRTWADRNIFAPLTAAIDAVKRDIIKYAVFAYDLLTHPDKLAALLVRALIGAAEAVFWDVAEPAGEFALRIVTKNLARWLHLAEAIITAVL